MRSFNKTISIIVFLLINIVCVTNGRKGKAEEEKKVEVESKELTQCKNELLKEFSNKEPLDDFFYALLNIKYETVQYNYDTKTNEEIFRGLYGILEKSAKCYYFELFYTVMDMDLPILPSPRDFCKTEHRNEKNECTRQIVAAGCKAHDVVLDCIRKLYFRWKMADEPISVHGTKKISDKDLWNAIHRGSDSFQDLSEEEVFERLSRPYENFRYLSEEEMYEEISGGSYIYPNLKDDDLLKDFFNEYGDGPVDNRADNEEFKRFQEARMRRSNFGPSIMRSDYNEYMDYARERNNSDSDFNTGYEQYMDRVRRGDYTGPLEYYNTYTAPVSYFNESEYRSFIEYMNGEREYQNARYNFVLLREKHLKEARFNRYGIRDVNFSYLCKEFNRRQNAPKIFDNLYAKYIRDKIKKSCDSSKFKDHTETCKKYLSENTRHNRNLGV